MDADTQFPLIHLNGSSPDDLVDAATNALTALHAAHAAMQATAPNGRDYYPLGETAAYYASIQHRARMRTVEDLISFYEAYATSILDRPNQKAG